MDEYESLDGIGMAEAVAEGAISAENLLDCAIERVAARDETLGALVFQMFDEARAAIAAGLPDGPFRGVPFLLKDLDLAWAGVPLSNGSRLFADHVPTLESEMAVRYRRAGLVVFGKTHSPEFGLTTSSESRLHGVTRNPWQREFSAGGSSGGAASAVVAGYTPLANASDGGGSIRIPASCCGLFGMKPTRGRTPVGPHAGEGWSGMATVHAVTRSVRDSAALLDATAGPDSGAPYAAQPPAHSFLREAGQAPGVLRIAVQRMAWNGCEPHPDCVAALEHAIEVCRSLGHRIEEAPFDANAKALGPAVVTIIGANTLATMEAGAARLGRSLRQDDVEPISWAMGELGRSASAADYVRALGTIHGTGRALAEHMKRYDVVLSPTMATPPRRVGVLSLSNPDRAEQAAAILQTVGYTQLANATGNPAMSVPLAWNAGGLPIGVQFMGRIDDEATLFRLAAQLESAQPWFDRRPQLG